MGYYIQGPVFGKAPFICKNYGGRIVGFTEAKTAMQRGEGVVVVVTNHSFEAAGFCFSEDEFEAFTYAGDDRPKTFVVMERALAEKLSSFAEAEGN